MISDQDKSILNNSSPDSQKVGTGTELQNSLKNSVFIVKFEIDRDGTAGLSIPIPENFILFEALSHSHVNSAGGTATIRNGTSAITNAMNLAAINTLDWSYTINNTLEQILTTDNINVITNGVNDRGQIILMGHRS